MKKLITILLLVVTGSLWSQTPPENIERWIRNTPPQFAQGMALEEILIDKCKGKYIGMISGGVFYKLHRETTCADVVFKTIDVTDVLFAEKTLLIWVEKGRINSSFDGIKSKNKKDIFMIWKVKFIILHGEICSTEAIDLRGFSLSTCFSQTY